jgi:hypothetical protein
VDSRSKAVYWRKRRHVQVRHSRPAHVELPHAEATFQGLMGCRQRYTPRTGLKGVHAARRLEGVHAAQRASQRLMSQGLLHAERSV